MQVKVYNEEASTFGKEGGIEGQEDGGERQGVEKVVRVRTCLYTSEA
jgi:hypothetical protein